MTPFRYNFGIYHWRRRFASIGAAVVAIALAAAYRRRTDRRWRRLAATVASVGAAVYATRVVTRLLSPPPWAIERKKYDALAALLPLERAQRVLDVGCGTGRSLVGLAPHVPPGREVFGLDVFDDRVILGNGAVLARRNAERAGLAVTPVAGDAARLPFADDSIDVVTASRVLHDLDSTAADRTLAEMHRVCAPDGSIGVLELPLVPEDVSSDPETYWLDRVSTAGFRIDTVERIDRDRSDEPYLVIVGTPVAES
ncbi:class I SAM-dependent methyltransferase [Natribaculum luteum]|uniref:Class I SAM-dependent methyltransferase n=1 Tax=Natribaculum luteum TaxID=1586232 RepID=A0ABD5P6H6_9EURY|nr:class I SAM-dependent methyltransferase [Natribaculum luteum]